MDKPDEKIVAVLAAMRSQIIYLTELKKSGKWELTVELNVSQGTIGDIYLHNSSRVKVT